MGNGNPTWARDEVIIALDLYLRRGQLDDGHPEVIEVSEILNSLPIHTDRPDREHFRNPNGVALKLANFAAMDPTYPGKGMQSAGRSTEDVWDELHDDPALVHQLATAIRDGAAQSPVDASRPEDNEDEVPEGRILYRLHRARERDRTIVKKKKAAVLKAGGTLSCEACGLDFGQTYGEMAEGYIECHHRIPLSTTGPTTTKLSDLALICANCHRVIHLQNPWISVEDLAAAVSRQSGH